VVLTLKSKISEERRKGSRLAYILSDLLSRVKMKVAIRDGVVGVKSLEELAEAMEELGVNSFEFWINRDMTTIWGESLATPDKQEDFGKRLKKLKLKICAGIVASLLANEDSEPEIDYVVKASQMLSVLGVKVLRIDVVAHEPNREPRTWQEYQQRAIRAVKECIRRTEKLGTEFAVENHGAISNRIEFLRGLYKGVNSPRLGHTLDTGNFYWYGYPLSRVYNIFEELAPVTKHTHIKNIKYPPEEREKTRPMGWEYEKYVSPLAEGDINLANVVKILKRAKFKNDLCIEDESLGRFPADQQKKILRQDVEYLKSLL